MEIIIDLPKDKSKLKVALFDFDGTISTLRHGWENIMEPLMIEMISGPIQPDDELVKEVRSYIDASTGIQTIHQMQWLLDAIKRYKRNPEVHDDPWWYKAEYNRRLMEPVQKRKNSIATGEKTTEDYVMKGSKEFLNALIDSGVELYVASGTDHPDVLNEVKALGLEKYFKYIAGAPLGKVDCSKEAVLRQLVTENQLEGQEVVVIGDGKVEIALGREVGARTLGVASDEENLCGVNDIKRNRLAKAGAHAIVGDYENLDEIMNWLGLQ